MQCFSFNIFWILYVPRVGASGKLNVDEGIRESSDNRAARTQEAYTLYTFFFLFAA